MTALVAPARVDLDAEWNRVELMARQVADRRANRSPEPGVVASLASLRRDVMQLRSADAAWNRVANGLLAWLDHEVLACVIAPEVEPRIRWLYQELQGGTAQPYPTRSCSISPPPSCASSQRCGPTTRRCCGSASSSATVTGHSR
jgi:hypothetical protein